MNLRIRKSIIDCIYKFFSGLKTWAARILTITSITNTFTWNTWAIVWTTTAFLNENYLSRKEFFMNRYQMFEFLNTWISTCNADFGFRFWAARILTITSITNTFTWNTWAIVWTTTAFLNENYLSRKEFFMNRYQMFEFLNTWISTCNADFGFRFWAARILTITSITNTFTWNTWAIVWTTTAFLNENYLSRKEFFMNRYQMFEFLNTWISTCNADFGFRFWAARILTITSITNTFTWNTWAIVWTTTAFLNENYLSRKEFFMNRYQMFEFLNTWISTCNADFGFRFWAARILTITSITNTFTWNTWAIVWTTTAFLNENYLSRKEFFMNRYQMFEFLNTWISTCNADFGFRFWAARILTITSITNTFTWNTWAIVWTTTAFLNENYLSRKEFFMNRYQMFEFLNTWISTCNADFGFRFWAARILTITSITNTFTWNTWAIVWTTTAFLNENYLSRKEFFMNRYQMFEFLNTWISTCNADFGFRFWAARILTITSITNTFTWNTWAIVWTTTAFLNENYLSRKEFFMNRYQMFEFLNTWISTCNADFGFRFWAARILTITSITNTFTWNTWAIVWTTTAFLNENYLSRKEFFMNRYQMF
jgi:type IV secretory pathway VirB3-like protein